jgi:hypothetical protein
MNPTPSAFDRNPVIARLRAERLEQEAKVKSQAQSLWATFTEDERTLVSFGMFPATKMPTLDRDELHDLTCALLNCATIVRP